MHSQVAHVAEEDDVAVLALPVVADAADGILVHQGVRIPLVVALEVGLLLQPVHQVLKDLLGNGTHAFGLPPLVHDVQPDVIFLVHVVLHLLVQLLCRLLDVPGRTAQEGQGPAGGRVGLLKPNSHRPGPRERSNATARP